MPLYRVHSQAHRLPPEQRRAFSQEVVDVHCRVTQAPPSFVHVLYVDEPIAGSGASEAVDIEAQILGTIRSGRTAGQKQAIIDDLKAHYASRAGIDPARVEIVLIDVEASSVMEGGKLLPEPGTQEERDWTS